MLLRPQLEYCPVLGRAGGTPGDSSENKQRCRKTRTCKDRLKEMGLFSLENAGERLRSSSQTLNR